MYWIRRGRRDHDGIVGGARRTERFGKLNDGGVLLPDRNVDAEHVFALLVQDRVEGDRGLPGLAVADDQFALTAADRDHTVDRLDPGLQRDADALAFDDAGRVALDRAASRRGDRTFAVDGFAEGVDRSAEHGVADRDADDAARPFDGVALFDPGVVRQKHDRHHVLLEVERHTGLPAFKDEKFVRHAVLEPVDLRDPVADKNDRPHFRLLQPAVVGTDLFLDDTADFFGTKFQGYMILSFGFGQSRRSGETGIPRRASGRLPVDRGNIRV